MSGTLSEDDTDAIVKEGITDSDKPTKDGTNMDSDYKTADQSGLAGGPEGPEDSTSAPNDDDSSDDPSGQLTADDSEDNDDGSESSH